MNAHQPTLPAVKEFIYFFSWYIYNVSAKRLRAKELFNESVEDKRHETNSDFSLINTCNQQSLTDIMLSSSCESVSCKKQDRSCLAAIL